MANMMDYLDWRGDLTFTASGFNEVDNLLFAELVYTSFDGIVTGQSEAEAVTLAEASAVFWEQNSREEILARVSMTKAAPFVLEKMAKTERFRDVSSGVTSMTSVRRSSHSLRSCAPGCRMAVSMCRSAAQTIRSQGGERILIWDTSRRRPVS